MKKQISIFIFCFAAMASFAQIRTGSFRLTVDENTYNKQRSGTILIEGMQNFQQNLENILIANMFPGTYNLSIYFRNTPNSPEQNVKRSFTIEPGKTINFTLSTAGYLDSKYLLDNNSVDIMMPNLPGMPNVNVNFSLGGSVHHDIHDNHGHHDNHDNRDNHHNAQVLPAHVDPVPISQADFNNLLASIRKESFDDTRVSTLKSACKFYPYFTSEHVKQLVSLITFEGDKLECAQYLAPKVIDVQNLPLIKDVFKFSTTKDEWLDFLGGF